METNCRKCGKKLKKTNIIYSVKKGSRPDIDGIKPGYKIVAIDNVAVQTYEDIINAVKEKETYKITLSKNNDTKDIEADKSYGIFLNVEFEDEKICSSCGAKQKSFLIPLILLAGIIILAIAIIYKCCPPGDLSVQDKTPTSQCKDPNPDKCKVGTDESNALDKVEGVNISTSTTDGISTSTTPTKLQGLSDDNNMEGSGHVIVPVNLYNMPVLFFFDTAKPHAEYADYIYSYVRKYKEEGNGRKILIEGFSCDYGTEEHNEDLSKMRAGYVRSEFIKAGIPAGNIQIKYYGKSRYPKMGYGLRKYYWRAQVSLK